MDPTLDPRQARLRDVVGGRLAQAARGSAAQLEAALVELSLLDLAVPRRLGGLGLGTIEQALAFEQCGLTGVPYDGLGAKFDDVEALLHERGDLDDAELSAGIDAIRAVGPKEGVGAPPSAGPAIDRRRRIRLAAYLVGLAGRASRLSQRRVRARHIGERALIEYQALAHRLAGDSLLIERARMEVWEAAWSDSEGSSSAQLGFTSLATGIEVVTVAARTLVQVHGAAGTAAGEVADIYAAAHAFAIRCGPVGDLWRQAAESAPPGSA